MTEIKFIGRGGQGAVIASQILAKVFFLMGKYPQCFSVFGGERRGAPVASFLRVDDKKIYLKCEIRQADELIYLAPDLVEANEVASTIKPGGLVLINNALTDTDFTGLAASRVAVVDALAVSEEAGLGTTINTAILGAYAKASGAISLEHLERAISETVPAKVTENIAAAMRAYEVTRMVKKELDQMAYRDITIKDIEPIIPFSRGSTEIFLTGQWSAGKPAWVEKTSPCRQGCPIGNDIARAFALASKGRIDEALAVFREENPLPGVCGRVCYHPCEPACNRKEMDSAINIRGFERFLADQGHVALPRPAAIRKERVAIIGSGPAGLSAAYHLARLGFHVTIFEALPEAGGMLMYGIPEYRLPKAVLRREIGRLVRLGVSIETNAHIAAEGERSLLAFSGIRRDHDAVFLAVGSHKGAGLGVGGGEGAKGVMEGIAFLRAVGMKEATGLGKRVAVIGGGNTAVDCARTAKRLGAKDVTVLYRRSKTEMPALAEDVEGMEGDGIKMELLAAPKRVVAEGGRVKAIECVRMTLGPPDAGGRATPVPIPGSEFMVPVDTVIAAVGQAPELDFVSGSGVAASARGTIGIDAMGATGAQGVFAGGDAAGTRAFVADAIASGKLGALAIYCYVEGKDAAREYEALRIGSGPAFAFGPLVHPDRPKVDLADVVTYDRLNTICVPFAKRNDNPKATNGARGDDAFAEVAGGLTRKKAEAEISRCFKCGTCTACDLCFLLCPDVSILKAREGGYDVRGDYCKGCGVCASACPRHVIGMEGGR